MSKFNASAAGAGLTVNKEGYVAYKMGDKEKLVTQVLNSFFGEQKFYGSTDNELVDTAQKVCATNPQFVANLAVFARKEFNLRSVSHILTAILAKDPAGKSIVRKLVPHVVVRADDMTEILSAYIGVYGKPIPNSLKKGIGEAIRRFDAYALSKYKSDGKSMKMKDLILICHPIPKDGEQSAMWKKLIEGGLKCTDTWEATLSARGNKKEVWEELIAGDKLGFMATLRNLRNIIKADVSPTHLNKVLSMLSDKDSVLKSRQLPFRFLSAYKELKGIPNAMSNVFDAVETALEHSVSVLGMLPGNTVIAVDVSYSMTCRISAKSNVTCVEIALLLGVMASRICENSKFITFSNKVLIPVISGKGTLLSQVDNISVDGGGTNVHAPISYLIENKIAADRIILLSDNEVNQNRDGLCVTVNSTMGKYRKAINPNCWIHAIDLEGYGTKQFLGDKTNVIAGWSEKVFDYIKTVEDGGPSLVKKIESYTYAAEVDGCNAADQQ